MPTGRLEVIEPEPSDQERELLAFMARMEQDHRQNMKPYVDALVRLKALRMPAYVFHPGPAAAGQSQILGGGRPAEMTQAESALLTRYRTALERIASGQPMPQALATEALDGP